MIREWVQQNIKEGRLQSGGREWVCNSVIDTSDYKRHMSVNLDTGLWQCFKSGETGNFYQLVSIVRGVPYHRGNEIFYSFVYSSTFVSCFSHNKVSIMTYVF